MDNSRFWWQAADAPGPGPGPGDPIAQSLRFRGAQYLNRTPTTAGDQRTWTTSFWYKKSNPDISASYYIENLMLQDPSLPCGITFFANGKLGLYWNSSGYVFQGTEVFRDPSAWYHVVQQADGATQSYKVFINGQLVADVSGVNTYDGNWNAAGTVVSIGAQGTSTPMHGYVAEAVNVDGQALDPTTFGRFNANGVWVPVDPKKDGDTAWYGANGFHLGFADPTDIGKDYSGNGNHFTATGFETTDQTSPLYDIMQDSPTNNFATFNAVVPDSGSNLTDANLVATNNRHNLNSTPSTISIEPNTGKYYWEITHTVASGNNAYGMSWAPPTDYGVGWYWSPKLNELYSASLTGRHPNYVSPAPASGVGVVQGFAYDSDTGNCWVRNDAGWYNSGDPDAGTNPFVAPADTRADLRLFPVKFGSTAGTTAEAFNFGQQPFKYDVPEGFEPLSTFYMPTDELPDEITGTFTGNSNADGPFVYTGCIPARIQYGTIDVKYQDRLGQTNVDFLSNGFKVRSTTSNSGTVNYTVTTTHDGGEYDGNKVPFNLPAPAVSN